MPHTNQTIQTILSRRSVRFGYLRDKRISRPVLQSITDCGLAAPSSKNAKPWRFHVVTSLETLDEIAAAVEQAPGIDEYVPHDPSTGKPHPHWTTTVIESAAALREVPAAIFIENRGVFSGGRIGLQTASPDALTGSLSSYAFECVGIGTAVENMWVAAISLGLSASFIGDIAIAEDHIAAKLGFDGDLIGVLAMGYSNAQPPEPLLSPAATQVERPVVWH